MNNKYTLLGLLQSYAPNGPAQQHCTNMVHAAERDGASDMDVEKMLVNAISDGLTHGNWPWVNSMQVDPRPDQATATDDKMLDKAEYERLRSDLGRIHVEDYVNLLTISMMDRDDVQVTHQPGSTLPGKNVVVGQFTLPAVVMDDRTYQARPFTVTIAEQS